MTVTPALTEFIRGLPKAELHLHLEGTLEPEQMFSFARRNRIEIPFGTAEEVRAAYAFQNLQDFLDIYYAGTNVLRTGQDFYDLTMAYLARVAADGAVHAEVFFDPQTHTGRGVPFSVVADGILAALTEGEKKFGLTAALIPCILRHLSEEEGFATLKEAEPYFNRLLGIGLDSSELGHPPGKFARLFEAARAAGLRVMAHAGEEGPAAYVAEALDILKADRIDHGNRVLDDPALVRRLVEQQITLTVCPLSNLKLRVVPSLAEHPVKQMLALGLRATVNSDDPAYFGGYLLDNYLAVASALELIGKELATLARNSILGSFLPDEAKARHVAAIDARLAAW